MKMVVVVKVMWHTIFLQMKTLSSAGKVWQSPGNKGGTAKAVRKMRDKGGNCPPFIYWFCALIGADRLMGQCMGSTLLQTKIRDK